MYEPVTEAKKEEYLKIWMNFSIGHLNYQQLAESFKCSTDTIASAIKWAAENRSQFKVTILAEAAKEAVEARLRELKNDLIRIKGTNPVNWNAVIGVNRVITELEQLLWKLQAVIQDRSIVTINSTQVNQLVQARNEAIEGMNDEQRQKLISSIRAITDQQGND